MVLAGCWLARWRSNKDLVGGHFAKNLDRSIRPGDGRQNPVVGDNGTKGLDVHGKSGFFINAGHKVLNIDQ